MLRPGGVLAVCDARPFPGRLRVLNPAVTALYARGAGWHADRDVAADMERIFGNVVVERFNLGSFFVATSVRPA